MATLKLIEIATEIVTSFVSNNSVPRGELAAVIESVHGAVQRLAAGGEVAPSGIEPPTPAVSIRKSVTPEYLICLDDGKRFKSLRRHLAKLGMTPEQYRAKWDLPATYPMVAPNYAAQRSALAKTMGLGQLREPAVVAPPPIAEAVEAVSPPPTVVVESEVVAPPPEPVVKRKPGRPRKAPA